MYCEFDGINVQEANFKFNGKKAIIFGAGSRGERVPEILLEFGMEVLGYCDNNMNIIGSFVNGYQVYSPDILKENKEVEVVIASIHFKEIKKQLEEMECKNIHVIEMGVCNKKIMFEEFRNKTISEEETNELLIKAIKSKEAFAVGRIGSVELECLSHYLYLLDRRRNKKEYPMNVRTIMNINAGFFPADDTNLDAFCKLYLESCKSFDFLWTMWLSSFEDRIYHEFYPDKIVSKYRGVSFPYQIANPWTKALEGKKVLVVHPFEESIQMNYKNRTLLFPETEMIPEFELHTLKAVQSITGLKTPYKDWFEALKYMEDEMSKIDFDIALIGAGAYGLPLSAHAKKLGKVGIHICGILQLYFGIKGKIWNNLNIYNQYWTSPREDETPKNFIKVENGRYW